VIGAIILGLVAGYLARALTPGRTPGGLLVTFVLGLAGAGFGYVIFTELLGVGDTEWDDLGGLPGAVIGAMILLWFHRRLAR
jgi:uncharacterized membrane protein YeaQ/YmgE (transglycosylase-associated protein family)